MNVDAIHPKERMETTQATYVRFACRACGGVHRASRRLVGRSVRCRNCGQMCMVPHLRAVQTSPTSAGLRLPPRVAHARYLALLESHVAERGELPLKPTVTPHSPAISADRLLIGANMAVLAAVIALAIFAVGRSNNVVASESQPAPSAAVVETAF